MRTASSRFICLMHAIYFSYLDSYIDACDIFFFTKHRLGLFFLPNPLFCGSGFDSGLVGLGLIRVDFDTN